MRLPHMACFELRRCASLPRWAVAGACIALSAMRAYANLATFQDIAGGYLEGSCALDVFYVAMNDQDVACLYAPVACLVLCGDLFSRDASGEMFELLLVRGGSRRLWWASKVIAALLTCVAFFAAACLAMTLADALLYGTGLGGTAVPAWLGYSGDTGEYLLPAPYCYSLIPASWPYPVLLLALVAAQGVICAAIVLLVSAACLPLRTRCAPVVLGVAAIVILRVLPTIYVNIAFLVDPEGSSWGISDVGMVLDRFCLSTYALGAGAFQTRVGGEAIVASELARNPGVEFAPEYLARLGEGYAVNSFASLALVVLAMLACACLAFSWWSGARRATRLQGGSRPGAVLKGVHHGV